MPAADDAIGDPTASPGGYTTAALTPLAAEEYAALMPPLPGLPENCTLYNACGDTYVRPADQLQGPPALPGSQAGEDSG